MWDVYALRMCLCISRSQLFGLRWHQRFHIFKVSYALFSLILGPYLKKTHGIGSISNDRKPSRLVAHPMPRVLYICTVKSGKTAPRA